MSGISVINGGFYQNHFYSMSLLQFQITKLSHVPKGSVFFEFRYDQQKPIQHKITKANYSTVTWEIEFESPELDYVEIVVYTKKTFHKKTEFGRAIIYTSVISQNQQISDWILIRKNNSFHLPLVAKLEIRPFSGFVQSSTDSACSDKSPSNNNNILLQTFDTHESTKSQGKVDIPIDPIQNRFDGVGNFDHHLNYSENWSGDLQ
jgi:hypothetical protein